jgi:sphingomyelin phosphodiesterase acid-like 3
MFKKGFFAAAIAAAFGFAGYTYLSTEKPDVQFISTANTKVQRNLLLISDMHVISMTLFNSYISKTDAVLNHTASLDFIIYSGDLPAHAGLGPISRRNIQGHDSDLVTALRGLQKLANNHPGIPLFYLPGNNDSEMGDYYPFGDNNNSAFRLVNDSKNPFPALNVNHESKKIPCLIDVGDTALCYYSAYPVEGLRLIALNTVVYTGEFCRQVKSANDIAEKEMQWLNAQLEDAKNKNEKVYIAMHMPPRYINYYTYMPDSYGWTNKIIPGKKGMKSYDQWFFSLVSQYKANCIEAVFYGHTHG